MNKVSKKRKKRRRRKAFVKQLRKALCCVSSEVASLESFNEIQEQANGPEDIVGVTDNLSSDINSCQDGAILTPSRLLSSVWSADTPGNTKIRNRITKVQSEDVLKSSANSKYDSQPLRQTLSEPDIKKRPDVEQEGWSGSPSITANFHQGSTTKFKSVWAGNQCTTMAMTGLLMSAIKPVHLWKANTLNKILIKGDKNHGRLLSHLNRGPTATKLQEENCRIGLFELKGNIPMKYENQYHTMEVCPNSQSSGIVFSSPEGKEKHDEFGTPLLKDALSQAMGTPDVTGAVMTVGEYSTGLLWDSTIGGYRMWDSHSRSPVGFHRDNGSAVLLSFKTLEEVQTHIELQLSMRGSPFETYDVVGFRVHLGEKELRKQDKKKHRAEGKLTRNTKRTHQ